MIERVDAQLRPLAVLGVRHRWHYFFVHVGQERVVDLHVEPCIDNGLVFLVQAVGERPQQALLVRIIFVLGVRQRAGRRDDRQEGAGDVGFSYSCFEVGDVALDLRVRISERPGDHEPRAQPLVQSRYPVVFRVEFGEGDAVLPATYRRHGIFGLFRGQRPGREAGEPVMDVEGPVAALAELAVADDVDARVGLLAHDGLDRFLETILVRALVVWLAILDLVQELDELRRPHQAANMGCEDAIG